MRGEDPQHSQTQWGENAAYLLFGIALVGAPLFGALAYVTKEIGPASIPIWFAVSGGLAWVLRGPVGHAIARAIGGAAPELPAEIPGEVYGELDELRARVAELEERVDFSERLLTSKAEDGRGQAP